MPRFVMQDTYPNMPNGGLRGQGLYKNISDASKILKGLSSAQNINNDAFSEISSNMGTFQKVDSRAKRN